MSPNDQHASWQSNQHSATNAAPESSPDSARESKKQGAESTPNTATNAALDSALDSPLDSARLDSRAESASRAASPSSAIDFSFFARYSTAAPRYTSYPTAVEFTPDFTYDDLVESYARNDALAKDSGMPLSLYVHLPFCRSACYFCGCNVIYTSKEDKKDRYIAYLEKELKILQTLMDTSRQAVQLHFGGGTPTFFDASQLERVIKLIRGSFRSFAPDAEISCEIDPRHFSTEQMQALKSGGFNRLSFGVQDFDERVQQAVHRFQSVELVSNAVQIARKAGIASINFDLIYGLPHQSLTSFMQTLEKVVALGPDRLAIFNYAHVPWLKKTMRKIDESALPAPSVKLEILKNTIDFLHAHGYAMIGMDHFAKTSDELYLASRNKTLRRNFQGYTTKGFSQTIGIGLTSIGEGYDYYAQNTKDLRAYEAALDSGRIPLERGIRLSDEDILKKAVIMELMNTLGLEFVPIEARFGIKFAEYFASELARLQEFIDLGVLHRDSKGLHTTPTGALLIRNIAMVFDSYLAKAKERTFSKTI